MLIDRVEIRKKIKSKFQYFAKVALSVLSYMPIHSLGDSIVRKKYIINEMITWKCKQQSIIYTFSKQHF